MEALHKVKDGVSSVAYRTSVVVADTTVKGVTAAGVVTTGTAEMVVRGLANQALEIKDAVVSRKFTTQGLIDAPTPEDRWFTPSDGWPREVLPLPEELVPDPKVYKLPRGQPPPQLCPTSIQTPALFEKSEHDNDPDHGDRDAATASYSHDDPRADGHEANL